MLGAFLAYSLTSALPRTPFGFWAGVLLASLVVAAIGLLEAAMFRVPRGAGLN